MEDDVSVLPELGTNRRRNSEESQLPSLELMGGLAGKEEPGLSLPRSGSLLLEFGLGRKLEKRSGNFSKHCSYVERNFSGALRFLKQSSHESLSHVNIQNSAFAISSRIGDKCHYFQRSR